MSANALPSGPNMENFNEKLLKTTAVTFSLEGISRDLQTFIQKKITFNNRNLKHISEIIRSLSSIERPKEQKDLLSNNEYLAEMIKHTNKEIQETNNFLNIIVKNVMDKEINLRKDLKTGLEERRSRKTPRKRGDSDEG